ncbi:MAG: hypothetical protein JXJ19_02385 [Elusimicrobia bacterium]|nr:hypothetical protein [Elusimicrobiota bacterium]
MKRTVQAVIVISMILAAGPGYILAASGYGTTGAQILNLDTSARIVSMGGANAGLSDDLNAVTGNPAGLVQMYGTEFQASRLIYFMDSAMTSFTLGQKIGKAGAAFKLKIFSTEDTYRDEMGYGSSKFDIKYAQYTLGSGFNISQRQSIGVAVNMVSETFGLGSTPGYAGDLEDSAMSCDAGWFFKSFGGDSFGAVVKNMGTGIKLDKKEDGLPLKMVIGGSHRMGRFILAWDALTSRQVDFAWQFGVEAEIKGIKARSGLMYITSPDVSLGFGIPYGNFCLDYAFAPHQDLGIAHRITLGGYF